MAGASFDRSELTAWEQSLASSGARARAPLGEAVRQAGQQLAETARSLVRGQIAGIYLKHYPNAITSEMVDDLTVEAGPESGRKQGGMGRGVEFGSVNHGPIPHMNPAVDVVAPILQSKAADVIAGVL